MTIHERIRQRREDMQMSQEALARLTGVTKGNVSSWEKGRAAPNRGRLQKVAEALRTTPEWLMFGEIGLKQKSPPKTMDSGFSQMAARLAKEFDALNSDGKLAVMELIFNLRPQ